jgi:acyl-CoA synthetase (AMP-forming)/AMP-acid ligase II
MLDASTLPALLGAAASTAPDADAFRYRDERLTYGDWLALSARLAGGLAARGIGRGDVVALLLPSTPLYHVAYQAAARLGAVTTGINVRYRRIEIGHVLRQ